MHGYLAKSIIPRGGGAQGEPHGRGRVEEHKRAMLSILVNAQFKLAKHFAKKPYGMGSGRGGVTTRHNTNLLGGGERWGDKKLQTSYHYGSPQPWPGDCHNCLKK